MVCLNTFWFGTPQGRTHRFSVPTFRLSGATIIGKTQCVATFYLFAHMDILSSGFLFFDILSSSLLFSSLLCLFPPMLFICPVCRKFDFYIFFVYLSYLILSYLSYPIYLIWSNLICVIWSNLIYLIWSNRIYLILFNLIYLTLSMWSYLSSLSI